jgi:hypothetical protein
MPQFPATVKRVVAGGMGGEMRHPSNVRVGMGGAGVRPSFRFQ